MQCSVSVTVVVAIALEAVLEQMEQVIEAAGRQAMRDALWQGDLAATLTALDALRPAAPAESPPTLDKTLSYLQGQRAWLGNYVAWQEAGYLVGSGSMRCGRSRDQSADEAPRDALAARQRLRSRGVARVDSQRPVGR